MENSGAAPQPATVFPELAEAPEGDRPLKAGSSTWWFRRTSQRSRARHGEHSAKAAPGMRPMMTQMNRPRLHRVLVLFAAVLVLSAGSGSASAGEAVKQPRWLETALRQLPRLAVHRAGTMKDYSREQFGPAWKDVDGNHCDTRDDILGRDLRKVVLKPRSTCTVATGTLHDTYTGKTIHFVRGVKTSAAVQIDHVVALGDAWRTGAATWTPQRRLRYANDRLVLLAVDGPANEAKGDGDAAEWLPPRAAYRCRYVARQVSIKTRYRLWLTRAEQKAITKLLDDCTTA
jgi:hypothetical protein